MAVKGWMVVSVVAFLSVLLTACGGHDRDREERRPMTCAEFQNFARTGVAMNQERNQIILINGENQKIGVPPEEATRLMGCLPPHYHHSHYGQQGVYPEQENWQVPAPRYEYAQPQSQNDPRRYPIYQEER